MHPVKKEYIVESIEGAGRGLGFVATDLFRTCRQARQNDHETHPSCVHPCYTLTHRQTVEGGDNGPNGVGLYGTAIILGSCGSGVGRGLGANATGKRVGVWRNPGPSFGTVIKVPPKEASTAPLSMPPHINTKEKKDAHKTHAGTFDG